ncbi:MAG: hypothetical protein AB1631_25570 [Acidobacteriota bacterium]
MVQKLVAKKTNQRETKAGKSTRRKSVRKAKKESANDLMLKAWKYTYENRDKRLL